MHTVVRLIATAALCLHAVDAESACNLIPSASKSFRGTLGDVEPAVRRARRLRRDRHQPGALRGGVARLQRPSPTIRSSPSSSRPPTAGRDGSRSSPRSTATGRPARRSSPPARRPGVGSGRVACIQAGRAQPVRQPGDRRAQRRAPPELPLPGYRRAPRTRRRRSHRQRTGDDRRQPDDGPAAVRARDDDLREPDRPARMRRRALRRRRLLPAVSRRRASRTSRRCRSRTTSRAPASRTIRRAPGSRPRRASTIDAAGNVLFPVHWSGVLIRQNDVPVPRLIRATMKSPLPFPVPDAAFSRPYTPEGAKLPPIFEPQSDPSITDPDVITLFGSADALVHHPAHRAPRRSLRRWRRAAAGSATSTPIARTSVCPTTCVGGANPDTVCTAPTPIAPAADAAARSTATSARSPPTAARFRSGARRAGRASCHRTRAVPTRSIAPPTATSASRPASASSSRTAPVPATPIARHRATPASATPSRRPPRSRSRA